MQSRAFSSNIDSCPSADMVCLTATEKNQTDAVLAPSREAGSPSSADKMGSARHCFRTEQNAKRPHAV